MNFKTTHMNLRKQICGLIAGCSMATVTMAQQDLTLYFMNNLQQSSHVNVVASPDTTQLFSLGLPVLSNTFISVGHNGFVVSDLIKQRADDSLYLDIENAFTKMKDLNSISANVETDLLSLRLRKGKNLFSFNVTDKINVEFDYPKSLFELVYYGNGNYLGETVNITGLGINAMHYREWALGWNRTFGNITVGARPKLLFGKSNVWTENSNVSIYTDASNYNLTLSSSFLIHTAGLPDISLDSASIEDGTIMQGFDPVYYMFSASNIGWGLDLGTSYHLTDKAVFSASVTDIGAIRWKNNLTDFRQDGGTFTFQGVNIDELMNDSTFAERMIDSLKNTFKPEIDTNASAYTTKLNTKFNLSASYNLNAKNTVSALFKGTSTNTGFRPSFTLGYVHQFGRIWNVGLSYSIMNNTYNNVGVASALKLGPFQFFMVTDNVVAYFLPEKAKSVNLRFGMNIVTYQRKHVSVPDKPKF